MARIPVQLVLFFTRGVGLATWQAQGQLEREVALYRYLAERLAGLTFVTYGNEADLAFSKLLPGIQIVCNRERLSERAYIEKLLREPPFDPSQPAILKSNQVWGAEVPLQLGHKFGKPVIVRAGYLLSNGHEPGSGAFAQASELERQFFTRADLAMVTTPRMAERLRAYGVPAERLAIQPNFVMTEHFKVLDEGEQSDLCLAVGRLEPEKNLSALLEAFSLAPLRGARLWIAGSGSQKFQLRRQAKEAGLALEWLGNVPHFELPQLLNRAAVFVQASLYEGHPKTLLEAMACGRAVVATNVRGIRDLIRDGETGLLCEPNAESLAEGLGRALSDPELRRKLGNAARQEVETHFAFEAIAARELDWLCRLAGAGRS